MKTTVLLILILAAGCVSHESRIPPPPLSPFSSRTGCRFSRETGTAGWRIKEDAVTGRRAPGHLSVNEAGNALFTGTVSSDNGGGFSSIQCCFTPLDVSTNRAIHIGLNGDGHRYQCRVGAGPNDPLTYAGDFQTRSGWQAIEIPFSDLVALRRDDRPDRPHYPGKQLSCLQILFGNGTAGAFRLEIDRIWLD